jgi:heat shock protein HslJ
MVIATITASVLAACSSTPETPDPLASPLAPIAGTWTLEEIGGRDVAAMLPEEAELPSLTIESDGSVYGNGGVNRFTSALDVDAFLDGAFGLAPVAATRRAGAPAAMQVEARFFRALDSVTHFDLDGNTLQLRRDDEQLMRLRRHVTPAAP